MQGFNIWLAPLVGLAALVSESAHAAPPAMVPVGTMVQWDASKDGPSKSFVSGGVTVTLSAHTAADGSAAPQIDVAGADGRAFQLVGDPGLTTASANAGVGRLDGGAPGLQVLFADFTGGAHCCDHIQVLEETAAGWRVADVATVEGDALETFPKDLDGDGVGDILLPDDRFAYAFTFFAGSYMPPRVWNVESGKVADVSTETKYAPVFRRDMANAEKYCRQHANGACAAFVADAARLGRRDWAWPIMVASWDRTTNWDWPVRCRIQAPPDKCPAADQQTFTNMPDALQAFLADNGYLPAR